MITIEEIGYLVEDGVDTVHVSYDPVLEAWMVESDGPMGVEGLAEYQKKSKAREDAYRLAKTLSDYSSHAITVRVWNKDNNLGTEKEF